MPANVTIGLPVFNGERYLKGAIRSLLAQTHTELWLLISDNASTDSTPEICRQFAEEDRRIHYVRQPENLGAVGNFLYVLERASSPYFMWAAHDDLWHPEFVEVTLGLLKSQPDAIAGMTAVDLIDEHEQLIRTLDPSGLSSPDPRTRARSVRPDGLNAVYGLFRRTALEGGRVEAIPGSDQALVFGLALRGRFAFDRRVLRTQRFVGYTPAVNREGLPSVAEKGVGPDAFLHAPNPGPMCRQIFGHIHRSALPRRSRAELYAYVAVAYWWPTMRNAWLHDSRARVRHAVAHRRYLTAGLLTLRHIVLAPGSAGRELRRR